MHHHVGARADAFGAFGHTHCNWKLTFPMKVIGLRDIRECFAYNNLGAYFLRREAKKLINFLTAGREEKTMRKTTIMFAVGLTALSILAVYSGVASAQQNFVASPYLLSTIGTGTVGPFSLVRFGGHGFYGGLGLGFYGSPSYGGSYDAYGGYYDPLQSGTRTEPNRTCVWSGREWKCYNFSDQDHY